MPATILRDPSDTVTVWEPVARTSSPGDRAAGPPLRQPGLLRHLAGVSLETARTRGVACAVHEALGMASLLREFRAHLLATPVEVRGAGYDSSLMLIELLIAREALAQPRCVR